MSVSLGMVKNGGGMHGSSGSDCQKETHGHSEVIQLDTSEYPLRKEVRRISAGLNLKEKEG